MSAQLDYRFTTLALLRAETFGKNDRGKIAHCLENNTMYWIIAEGSGADVMSALPSRFGEVDVPLNTWRECDANGDVGAITANGGVLASDTTPILLGIATTEVLAINWAAGNADPIISSVSLPDDLDGTLDVTAVALVTAGTTNAFSATLETSWEGGSIVSDTLAGSQLATAHEASATIALADVPDTRANTITIKLTPGTHATDAFQLLSFKLRYYRQNYQAT